MIRPDAWILAAVALAPPTFAADFLPIDASHSAVVFQWEHRGFSHPFARLEKVGGRVILDRTDMTRSSVEVTMPLEGLRTGDEHLDKRLRGLEFFDIARYPDIAFRSTRIEATGSQTLRIFGELTVHGVTQPVSLDAKINRIEAAGADKPRAGFDAQARLRRSDFGLSRYVPMVGDEIFVHITLEAGED